MVLAVVAAAAAVVVVVVPVALARHAAEMSTTTVNKYNSKDSGNTSKSSSLNTETKCSK